MPVGNIHADYDSVPYGAVASLPETESIPASSYALDARAEAVLAETPDELVLAAAPESLATAYSLAATSLTVQRLDGLPEPTYRELADRVDVDCSAYEVLVWGSRPRREDHELSEFV